MQNSHLEIVITAKDEASAKMQGFANKVKSMQPAFRAMAVAGGAAFAGIAAFAVGAIKATAEAEQVQAQLGAVLKSTGGIAGVTAKAAIDLSKALQKTTTFSDEAILSTQNLLLTFTKIGKDIMPEATETVLDMATALGTDTKGAAIQLGKALNDPVAGISALTRVGVTFSEEQKNVIKRLMETGQIAAAQKIILAELNTEFGGSAAAAADTYAGKLAQLKNQFNEVQEEVGNALIPILSQLVAMMLPVIEKTIAWVQAHPELTKNIILAAGAIAGLVFVLGTLGIILPAITTAFVFLAGPVGIVIGILVSLGVTVRNVVKIFELFRTDSKAIWEGIKIMFKEYIQGIVDDFNRVIEIVQKVMEKLRELFNKAKETAAGASAGALSVLGISPKAQGGNVMAGGSYLVGERGPELFTPASSGSIAKAGSFGGGGGITVNILGGTYLSESVAHDIGDMIIERFKKVARI